MDAFTYSTHAVRVIFGYGSLSRVGEEVARLGCTRVLVLSTPGHRGHAERVAYVLGSSAKAVFDRAVMHVPIDTARAATAEARRTDADGIVAIGGGSTTGLAKAVALELALPIIAIPTTYAGSEATPIYGLTEGGLKRTGRDPAVLPKTIVYDPSLTLELPHLLGFASAMNAIAHAAEGLYAADRNPVTNLLAVEGMRAIASAIPRMAAHPADRDARSDCLYGAWLCGTVLGSVGMALHHKLCHAIGGRFGLPHAETHSCLLPHTLAYNASCATAAMAMIARAIERPSAPSGLHDLARENGATLALRDIGLREDQIDAAVELALANPYPNPRPLERAALRSLLINAWAGERPVD